MKNYFFLAVLLFSFVLWQGCDSKAKEAKTAADPTAEVIQAKNAEDIAVKRANLETAKKVKEEQRRLVLAEKLKAATTYKDASGKTIYYKAEIDPSYTGGHDALRKYLKANLQYPEEAREKGLEGTVFVDFVIDEKGRVREVVASDVVGEDVDISFKEEAVRVVAAMPGWNAGLQHGKAVDASFSIPISFQLGN